MWTENFDNGTPNKYAITENGEAYLANNFNGTEIIEYIKTLNKPDLLLTITQSYIDKKKRLITRGFLLCWLQNISSSTYR